MSTRSTPTRRPFARVDIPRNSKSDDAAAGDAGESVETRGYSADSSRGDGRVRGDTARRIFRGLESTTPRPASREVRGDRRARPQGTTRSTGSTRARTAGPLARPPRIPSVTRGGTPARGTICASAEWRSCPLVLMLLRTSRRRRKQSDAARMSSNGARAAGIGSDARRHVADVDGDGDLDLVGSTSNTGDSFWFENDGTMSFTQRFVNEDMEATPGDLDGDGDADFASAGAYGESHVAINVFEDGTYTTHLVDGTSAAAFRNSGAFESVPSKRSAPSEAGRGPAAGVPRGSSEGGSRRRDADIPRTVVSFRAPRVRTARRSGLLCRAGLRAGTRSPWTISTATERTTSPSGRGRRSLCSRTKAATNFRSGPSRTTSTRTTPSGSPT